MIWTRKRHAKLIPGPGLRRGAIVIRHKVIPAATGATCANTGVLGPRSGTFCSARPDFLRRLRHRTKYMVRRASLKSAKKKAVSLARTIRARSLKGGSSVESLILEKLPSKDLEGDFQVSIWAHG